MYLYLSKIYMMIKKLPLDCPSCGNKLKVKSLQCENCLTNIDGIFDLPLLARLSQEDQDFILHFVLASGSLKEMARHLNLSYPTVRNMLDDLIKRLNKLHSSDSTK
jgi:hypothetical protein